VLLQYSAIPHEFTRVVPVEGQDSRCLFFHEMIYTNASHDTSLHMCRYMYRILMLLPYLASLVDRQIDCRKWLARFRFSPPFLLPFTCKRAIKRKTHIHLLTDHMIQTTFRVRLAHQCPGRDQLRTLRSLTHLRDMASNLNSMPQKEPTGRETGQDSTEITRNQANQSDSRPVKNRSRPSRASTQAKDKDIGASSSNNSHGTFSSSQSTQHSNRSHNPNSTANRRLNSGAGQNNIHSTATSTRPSFLNSQWRTHSTQASSQEAGTPSTTDTEGLTQALQQLTTEDKAQDTATATNPTKSRWRTAKPNSKQQTSTNHQTSSNNPATTSTKTPSNNPTAHFFYTKAPPGLRRPQRHQGTATGLHSIEASWTLH
jgi:hypothetical protein